MKDLTEIILALSLTKGINRKTIHNLYNNIKSIHDINEIIHYFNKTKSKVISFDKNEFIKNLDLAKNKINEAKTKNIKILNFLDENFPVRFNLIADFPVLIYVKGNMELLNRGANIAIIGTREPTENGKKAADRLSTNFTERGFNIISGLANGCDQIAHSSCIKNNGHTIAVLPSGINNICPKSNKELAEQIISSKGLLISEYPINHKPFKKEYIERDRLQSALSELIIVVETDIKGGTMHTVNYALEQKKMIACYKHLKKYQNESKAQGNMKLILENKAFPISTKKDIDLLEKKVTELEKAIEKKNTIHLKQKLENTNKKMKIEQMKLI